MTRTATMAVVLEGGLVQSILLQDWPAQLPLPRIAVVDYDINDAGDHEITQFTIDGKPAQAICRAEVPETYESFLTALSPRAVLTALEAPMDDDGIEPPLSAARSVRQSILDLDARLNDAEQAPTGDDYNHLYVLANCGLIDVLKAMGDPTDCGE